MAGQGPPYNARMTQAPFNWKQPAGRALEVALNRALAKSPTWAVEPKGKQ